EKEQLSKEGGIKKQKKLPEISEPEILFDLPVGWVWRRLNDFGIIFNGNSLNSHEKNIYSKVKEGLPYIATKDVGYGSLDVKYDNGLIIPFLEPKFKIAHANSILICSEGGSAGRKICLINRDVCFGNKLFAIETFDGILPKYVFYLCQSRFFKSLFNEKMKGIIGGISLFNFLSLVVPLPPLNEQHRIVAIVDQLMSLCDELEARQQKKRENRAHLNSAALDRLLAARAPDKFAQSWRRIADNFDLLYDAPKNVGALRQAILQLAVMGKLVEQDPNEETASDFLERVCGRQALVLASSEEDSIDKLKIPNNWAWSLCECLCQPNRAITYGVIKLGPSVDNGVPILRSSDVRWLQINETGVKRISPAIASDYSRTFLKGGEIVVTVRGTLGGVAIVPPHMEGFNISREVAVIPINTELNAKFFCFAVASIWSQNWLAKVTRGIAYTGINIKDLKQLPLPIPPLPEQARIVAKLDQLMSLCDKLEAGLLRSQADSERLLEAVVGRMLSG
ncbi:MAG: hypothetical protein D4R88_09905, partial [Methanosarcinales archaeon]